MRGVFKVASVLRHSLVRYLMLRHSKSAVVSLTKPFRGAFYIKYSEFKSFEIIRSDCVKSHIVKDQ